MTICIPPLSISPSRIGLQHNHHRSNTPITIEPTPNLSPFADPSATGWGGWYDVALGAGAYFVGET